VDKRISGDGGGRGEDQRHDQAQDRGAQQVEQQRQNAERRASGDKADKPRPNQAGAGLIGKLRKRSNQA